MQNSEQLQNISILGSTLQYNNMLLKLADHIRKGEIKDTEEIIEYLDINKKVNGTTLLHLAVEEEQAEIIRLLHQKQANLDAVDDNGDTPLHVASLENRRQMLEILLERGANIQAKNLKKNSALHLAVEKGRTEIVELLLSKGAAIDDCNEEGNTPLHVAILKNKPEISAQLLKWNPSTYFKNKDGKTLRDMMSKREEKEWVAQVKICDDLRLLLMVASVTVLKQYENFQLCEIITDDNLVDFVVRFQQDPTFIICFKRSQNQTILEQIVNYVRMVNLLRGRNLLKSNSFKYILCISKEDFTEPGLSLKIVDSIQDDLDLFNCDGIESTLYNIEEDCKNLDKLKSKEVDDSTVKYFAARFQLISLNTNPSQLHELILKAGLGAHYSLSSTNSEIALFQRELCTFLKQFPEKPLTYDESEELVIPVRWSFIERICLKFREEKRNEIELQQINFKNQIKDLKNFITQGNQTKSFSIRTECVPLTSIKVFKTLDSECERYEEFLFVDDGKLQDEKTKQIILRTLETSDRFSILVLATSNPTHCVDILLNLRNRKIIIISENEYFADHQYRDIDTNFNSLDRSSQEHFLRKTIKFPYAECTIGDLFTIEVCEGLFESGFPYEALRSREICVYCQESERHTEEYFERTFSDTATNRVLTENDILDSNFEACRKLFLVSGEADLGKTLFLKQAKNQLQLHGYWVLSLNLNRFSAHDLSNSLNCGLNSVCGSLERSIELLIEMLNDEFGDSFSSSLSPQILTRILNSSKLKLQDKNFKGVVVLFDGIEEIHPEYFEKFMRFVHTLSFTNIQRIWLTTRTHEVENILQEIDAFHLCLKPFAAEHQMKYLLALIKKHIEANGIEFPLNRLYNRNANLEQLFRIATSFFDDGFSISAQKFRKDFDSLLGYTVSDRLVDVLLPESLISSLFNNPKYLKIIIELSFQGIRISDERKSEVLEKLVDYKFQTCFESEKVSFSDGPLMACMYCRKKLEAEHGEFAYYSMYAPRELTKLRAERLRRLCRVGFVTYTGGKYCFVRPCFATYFCALYFSSNLRHSEPIQKILVMRILSSNYDLSFCSVLNRNLECYERHVNSCINLTEGEIESILRQQPLYLAASRGHVGIVKLLFHILKSILFEKCFLNIPKYQERTILDAAADSSSFANTFAFFKKTCTKDSFEKILNKSSQFRLNFLKASTRSGEFKEFLEFFKKHNLELNLNELLLSEVKFADLAVEYFTFDRFVAFLNDQCDKDVIKEVMLGKRDEGSSNILSSAVNLESLKKVTDYLRTILNKADFQYLLFNTSYLLCSNIWGEHLSYILDLIEEFCTKDSIKNYLMTRLNLPYFLMMSLDGNTHEQSLKFLRKYINKDEFDTIASKTPYYLSRVPENFPELLNSLKQYCYKSTIEKIIFHSLECHKCDERVLNSFLRKVPEEYYESIKINLDKLKTPDSSNLST